MGSIFPLSPCSWTWPQRIGHAFFETLGDAKFGLLMTVQIINPNLTYGLNLGFLERIILSRRRSVTHTRYLVAHSIDRQLLCEAHNTVNINKFFKLLIAKFPAGKMFNRLWTSQNKASWKHLAKTYILTQLHYLTRSQEKLKVLKYQTKNRTLRIAAVIGFHFVASYQKLSFRVRGGRARFDFDNPLTFYWGFQ